MTKGKKPLHPNGEILLPVTPEELHLLSVAQFNLKLPPEGLSLDGLANLGRFAGIAKGLSAKIQACLPQTAGKVPDGS